MFARERDQKINFFLFSFFFSSSSFFFFFFKLEHRVFCVCFFSVSFLFPSFFNFPLLSLSVAATCQSFPVLSQLDPFLIFSWTFRGNTSEFLKRSGDEESKKKTRHELSPLNLHIRAAHAGDSAHAQRSYFSQIRTKSCGDVRTHCGAVW